MVENLTGRACCSLHAVLFRVGSIPSGASAGGWVARALQHGMRGDHDGRTWHITLRLGGEACVNRREDFKLIAPPSPSLCVARRAVGRQSPTTLCGNAWPWAQTAPHTYCNCECGPRATLGLLATPTWRQQRVTTKRPPRRQAGETIHPAGASHLLKLAFSVLYHGIAAGGGNPTSPLTRSERCW